MPKPFKNGMRTSKCPVCRETVEVPRDLEPKAAYRCECGAVALGADFMSGRFTGVLYVEDERPGAGRVSDVQRREAGGVRPAPGGPGEREEARRQASCLLGSWRVPVCSE